MLLDIHTHRHPGKWDGQSIISLSVGEEGFTCSPLLRKESDIPISIGLHPWHVDGGWKGQALDNLIPWLSLPQVAAIGEAGIDRLRGGDTTDQLVAFEYQAQLAKEAGKPLIVHCVKAFDEVIHLHKRAFKHEAWVIHGFRGKPEQAHQLLREGFYLSFGEHYHDEALRLCPTDHLLIESDESTIDIETLYARAATLRDTGVEELKKEVNKNIKFLLKKNNI